MECKVSHGLDVRLYPTGTILLDTVTEQPEQSIYKAEENKRLHVVPLCGSLRLFVHFLGFFLFLLNSYISLKQNFCSYCSFTYLTSSFFGPFIWAKLFTLEIGRFDLVLTIGNGCAERHGDGYL